jgi:hypothetical protein
LLGFAALYPTYASGVLLKILTPDFLRAIALIKQAYAGANENPVGPTRSVAPFDAAKANPCPGDSPLPLLMEVFR